MRRLWGVLAVAGVVALVAGCSSSSPSPFASSPPPSSSSAAAPSKQADDLLPDPAALLKESSATTKNLKSVHLALSVAGKVAKMPVKTLQGDLTKEPGAAVTTPERNPTKDPSTAATTPERNPTKDPSTAATTPEDDPDNEPSTAAKGNATITVMGAEVHIKFVSFGDRLYVALPGGGGWRDYGPTSAVYDVAAILNPDTGLANMLNSFVDPAVEARETVRGLQTIRVVGKVTVDAVNKIVPLDATKRMTCTVWIQESGDHQLVQAELEPSKDDSIQMALSNWNAPVTVDKPPV